MDRYLEFAEEARQATSRALLKLATGQPQRAVEILEVFSERCGRIVTQGELAQDQANLREGTFDLGALNESVAKNLHADQPERDAD